MFGKRKKGGGNGGQTREAEFPWSGDAYAPCNFALGHLRDNLIERVKLDGRVHAETLVAAIGCVIGFSAQGAVFTRMKQQGIAPVPPHVNVIGTSNGRQYYLADGLNNMLVGDPYEDFGGMSVWSLVAGAAVGNGLEVEKLPQLNEMFGHVASQLGAERMLLRVGRHGQPMLPPEELLKVVWPLAKGCLDGSVSELATRAGKVPVRYWPLISAYVANQYLTMVKDTLDPAIAVTICMESAIISSKVSPQVLDEPVRNVA